MDSPDLDNKTEFAAFPQMLLAHDGEQLVTIVKASFELPDGAEELEIAPAHRNRGVRMADIPWGDPEVSSIAYPADLFIHKPGTDVIVVGVAHAPKDQPVPSFDIRVEVGPLSKSLRIFGSRVWMDDGHTLTKPQPISERQMRYEHTYGGYDDSDPENIIEEPRNPIGVGKVRTAAALKGSGAPSIEDPGALITDPDVDPAPAGIGAVGRHWEPRRGYAGTYDDKWQELIAPLPPSDFDDRFNLCASPGLTASPPLLGGEEVGILNLLPGGGARKFKLPKIEVTIEFRVKGREPVIVKPYLDTVLIDLLMTSPDKPPAVELVWRSHVKAPRRMKDARIIVRERDIP